MMVRLSNPLAGSQGKMLNYWTQIWDPALMDVKWDNQEANNNRNICQREHQSRALHLAWDNKMYPSLLTVKDWLTILCFLRAHEYIPTQRASSSLTAVHEASAGLTALVWLNIDTHTQTHTPSQHREHRGGDNALLRTWKAKKQNVVFASWASTVTNWKRPLSFLFVPLYRPCLWCGPESPNWVLWLKVALCTERLLQICVALSELQH